MVYPISYVNLIGDSQENKYEISRNMPFIAYYLNIPIIINLLPNKLQILLLL